MVEEQGKKKTSANAVSLLTDDIVTRLALTNFLPHQGQKEESLTDHATWVQSFPSFLSCGNLGNWRLSKSFS